MSELVERRAWDRMPTETDSSWAAFTMFLEMPVASPDRKERRSLNNLKRRLNHSSTTTVADWSRKYQWITRARARDMNMGVKIEEMRMATLDDMQRAVVQTASYQVAKLNSIIDSALEDMLIQQNEGNPISIAELKRIADAIRVKDDVMRRIASLPTEYKFKRVDEMQENEDDKVYILGGFKED